MFRFRIRTLIFIRKALQSNKSSMLISNINLQNHFLYHFNITGFEILRVVCDLEKKKLF